MPKRAYLPEERSHRGSVPRNKARCSRADVAPWLGAGFESGLIDRCPLLLLMDCVIGPSLESVVVGGDSWSEPSCRATEVG